MEIFVKASQLILSLSILVLVHEMGHFFAARFFKVRVESFYLFFNPWFSLFKYKHGETTYGIGWLPLGGYVKIAGMIDESLDREQMKKEPQPWEFRSKPAWQRLIIMVGGVVVNMVMAFMIYIAVLAVWGEKYLSAEEMKYGITVSPIAYEMGLRDGDIIISLDGTAPGPYTAVPARIALDNIKTVSVIREGVETDITVPSDFIARMLRQRELSFIDIRIPFVVDGFGKDSPAEIAGIEAGDQIIALNNEIIPFFFEFRNALQNFSNQTVNVGLIRQGDTLNVAVTLPDEALLGVKADLNLAKYFNLSTQEYTFLQAIPAGFQKGFQTIGNYLKQLRLLVNIKSGAYKSVGSVLTIGSIFPSVWIWQAFWELTAFLSVMLAILNILPIPALDGGHVVFLMYELVTRRKPSDRVLEVAQVIGMVLLLTLVVLAFYNDIRNFLF
jgi:regulator of sigma E protease